MLFCAQKGRQGTNVCGLHRLNRESPKDDFPLPHIDILVDNTAQHKVFSFMDGFSRSEYKPVNNWKYINT